MKRFKSTEVTVIKGSGLHRLPCADGAAKQSGTCVLRHPRPLTSSSERDDTEDNFVGSQLKTDESDILENNEDPTSFAGELIYRRHVVPHCHLCVAQASPFPIPLKYIDFGRITGRGER